MIGRYNPMGYDQATKGEKVSKIVSLEAYKRGFRCPENTEPEFLTQDEVAKLVREGRWTGTYTPPAPCEVKSQEEENGEDEK